MKRILLICITILVSTTTYGYTRMAPNMTGQGTMDWGYGMGWGWSVIMFVFWVAVIVGIFILIRWVVLSTDRRHENKAEDSALEIIGKRYASGEINREEFEEKKEGLA